MEWVEKQSGAPQMIKFMHTYPSHNTSTQKTEMDLCNGSKDLTVPSIMFMIFLQGTLLSSGKPLGRPPDSVLVRDISLLDAPKSDPGGMGALEDTATTLEFWESRRGRDIFFSHHHHLPSFFILRCWRKIREGMSFLHVPLA